VTEIIQFPLNKAGSARLTRLHGDRHRDRQAEQNDPNNKKQQKIASGGEGSRTPVSDSTFFTVLWCPKIPLFTRISHFEQYRTLTNSDERGISTGISNEFPVQERKF
jgi:hypothetical protein